MKGHETIFTAFHQLAESSLYSNERENDSWCQGVKSWWKLTLLKTTN